MLKFFFIIMKIERYCTKNGTVDRLTSLSCSILRMSNKITLCYNSKTDKKKMFSSFTAEIIEVIASSRTRVIIHSPNSLKTNLIPFTAIRLN